MSAADSARDESSQATSAASTTEEVSRANRAPSTEAEILEVHVKPPKTLTGPVLIVDYDPVWPQLFACEEARIRAALGERAVLLQHAGSTSVPGLAAKPCIDIVLVVPDSADEPAYVPALEAAGYELVVREPQWYEHRVFKGPDTNINLHVFSPGCEEIGRMLRFRDWLRGNAADRQLYERTKRELAQRQWKYMQNYADAKTAVVEQIVARALAAGGEHAGANDTTP